MTVGKPKNNLDFQIEQNLRKVYERTVQEEVPDRFKDLLQRLKDQESSLQSSDDEEDFS